MTGAALLIAAAVTIQSSSACPSVPAVQAALARLLPGGVPAGAAVRISETADGLSVAFTWTSGGPAESRTVAVGDDCGQRADAAAVVIASWAGALPDAAPPPTPERPRLVPARQMTEVALAGLVDADARPGGRLEVDRGPPAGLGWLAAVSATTEHAVTLGPARSLWTRGVLVAGPRVRAARGAWRAQVDAGPAASVVFARGSGYDRDRRSAAFDVGAQVGARVGVGGRRAWAWLDLRGAAWARQHRLVNDVVPDGLPRTSAVPRTGAQIAVGVSLLLP